ncbi:LysR substrate-binding domain-containing protein [Salmonella enterica subsp. enterica serovar 4,[5],12,[27]:e,h:-]
MLRKIRWRSTSHHGCRSQTSGNKTGVIKLTKSDDVRRLFSRTQPPKGRLRLDVPITLARTVIIPALGDFQNRYPDIEIVLGTSDRKIDLIAERVDCVVQLA